MPSLTATQARRFQAHLLGLDEPFESVGKALAHLGYIQIDPINVCGRMHDLILRPRMRDYAEGQLLAEIHGTPRLGFEHYLPGQGILVAFPFAAWPYLHVHHQACRTSGRGYARQLTLEEETLARHILAEIKERGPLTSDEIDHDARAETAWGTRARAVKTVLEKLFIHGRVGIASRKNFRRVYDLPERIIPAEVRAHPAATKAESARWLARLRLRQRRLVHLPAKDLLLIEDQVAALEVEGCPNPLYCLREDLDRIDQALATPPPPRSRLLAPLDPLLYDRKLTARVWNFEYTWEVYTPAAKRVRGYYALPILSGDELVGHVDPKANRQTRRLEVVGRKVRRGHTHAPAVRELARFLDLR